MLVIEALSTSAVEFEQVTQAVADIEAMVQPQDAWRYKTLRELLGQDSVHMIVVYAQEQTTDRQVVGYCVYQAICEQAEILRIGTHPSYQRQGVATQTMNKLHEVLQSNQVESLLLEVRADNHAAIALYEQQAFRIIHKRKGYYQSAHEPAVDALIMQHDYTK